MSPKPYYSHLDQLYQNAPVFKLTKKQKWVIFSDLHMGNGSTRDNFLNNSHLFLPILKKYYLKKGYRLILNGDIEELQRFSLKSILERWADIYTILDQFHQENRLIKTLGNHDRTLISEKAYPYRDHLLNAVKLDYKGQPLFVLHGDQASDFYVNYNHLSGFILKYIANPLGIHSTSAAYDSRKRYIVEKRIYKFAETQKLISIIGHTHRPLFESLSKVDFLKYKIEALCREYDAAEKKIKKEIQNEIAIHKHELQDLSTKRKHKELSNYVYNSDFILPCVFNSGCVIGKRGITCLEITHGNIALVHWFDNKKQGKYFKHYENKPEPLKDTNCYRMVLKEDCLKYITNRIKLLT